MKVKVALLFLGVALASATSPATAQSRGIYDLAPGALVNLVFRLYRPISVDLTNAPLAQAVRTISEASHVVINVDTHVPADAHVTLSTRAVPLGVVLERLAQQTNVQIAPTSSIDEWYSRQDQALLIVPAPAREAGAPSAPYGSWSDEWGLNPIAGAFPTLSGAR